MRRAQQQAHSRLRGVRIANMYYRSDIGNRWSTLKPALVPHVATCGYT